MSAQRTPGPWAYEPESGEIHFSDGDVNPAIAALYDNCSRERQDADGRLLAAAPDLLEALEDCLVLLRDVGRVIGRDLDREAEASPSGRAAQAYAAIAKARGAA